MANLTFTRFDFHAFRFLHSDNVKAMDTEEVGQYILLLCEAWCGGKNATLPSDLTVLARLARVRRVSKLVMAQFHKVTTEWGERFENETLTKEWNAAMSRSKSASERGKKGNESRWSIATASLQRDISEASAVQSASPISVSYQAVPDQTEPETETMSMKKRILEIAGKRNMSQFEADDVRRLHRLYGENLIEDFRAWMDEQPQGSDLYISSYLKVAESRLKGEQERGILQSDSRINEIVAFVYTVSQQAARGADITRLLADHSQEEIQDAFKAYTDNLDDFGLKGAARAFFKDGAGTGIILARRQKKAAEEKQVRDNAASIEVGVAQRRALQEELAKKIADEKSLADKLGDSPF